MVLRLKGSRMGLGAAFCCVAAVSTRGPCENATAEKCEAIGLCEWHRIGCKARCTLFKTSEECDNIKPEPYCKWEYGHCEKAVDVHDKTSVGQAEKDHYNRNFIEAVQDHVVAPKKESEELYRFDAHPLWDIYPPSAQAKGYFRTCPSGYTDCNGCCDIDGDCKCDQICKDTKMLGCSFPKKVSERLCPAGFATCKNCCDVDADCSCDQNCPLDTHTISLGCSFPKEPSERLCPASYNTCSTCCDADADCKCDQVCGDYQTKEKPILGCSFPKVPEQRTCPANYYVCPNCCDLEANCACDDVCGDLKGLYGCHVRKSGKDDPFGEADKPISIAAASDEGGSSHHLAMGVVGIVVLLLGFRYFKKLTYSYQQHSYRPSVDQCALG